jgi:heptosyltransferase-1
MRVLIIKTSSLGDIIHTLPALTDAQQAYPDIQFDWVVEESFQHIPKWHPAVSIVFPVALRRWRKQWFSSLKSGEIFSKLKYIRSHHYDAVIDAQGLMKSAILAFIARGKRSGFNFKSARENTASLFYHDRFEASWMEHAVSRSRRLFASALRYSLPTSPTDYKIDVNKLPPFHHSTPYYVFLHGTTWENKHWPESYWIALAKQTESTGNALLLLWGNPMEKERAERIASAVSNATVLPKMSLEEIVGVLDGALGIVSVDTGLGHLAAALAIPTVSLYGPTNPTRTGMYGQNQVHLASNFSCSPCLKRGCSYLGEKPVDPPCFTSLSPERVFQQLLNCSASKTT